MDNHRENMIKPHEFPRGTTFMLGLLWTFKKLENKKLVDT